MNISEYIEREKIELQHEDQETFPYWFRIHEMAQYIESKGDIYDIVFKMDINKPIFESETFYNLKNDDDERRCFKQLKRVWANIVKEMIKGKQLKEAQENKLKIPIESMMKAVMNYQYINSLSKIMSKKKSWDIRINEIGGGSGFLGYLIALNKVANVYTHRDVYQPYYASQSFMLEQACDQTEEVIHIDLAEVSEYQKGKVLSKSIDYDIDYSICMDRYCGEGIKKKNCYYAFSIPWWEGGKPNIKKEQSVMWVINDCIQEMEKEDAECYIREIEEQIGENDYVIMAGSGAPRGWYIYDFLLSREILKPLFMGCKDIPFIEGPKRIHELHILASKYNSYIKQDDYNITFNEAAFISRGLFGEIGGIFGCENFCYINKSFSAIATMILGEEIRRPTKTGLYKNGTEVEIEYREWIRSKLDKPVEIEYREWIRSKHAELNRARN